MVFFLLRLRDWLDAVMGWLLVVLMATVAVVVFLQVFYRYVLNNPLPWPEETARMAVVWLSFVAPTKPCAKAATSASNLLVAASGDVAGLRRRPGRSPCPLVPAGHPPAGIVMMILTMQDPMPYTGVSIGLWVYCVFPVAGFCMALDTALKIWSSLPHRRGKSLGLGK